MNELFINKKIWNTFSDEELETYIQKVFTYYRNNEFPYFKLDITEQEKVFNKMIQFDSSTILLEDDKLKQVMHGLNLVNYYMPHMWETKCHRFKTPMDCFTDDVMLLKAIRKRVKHGDNMSDAGMRKVLSWTAGTHRVSNFRPTIAKYIYDKYSASGNILDFSSGYGGRLLGAMSSDKVVKYTGVDPNTTTYKNLLRLKKFSDKDIEIINKGIETLDFEPNSFDLSFSSPPYFNTEEYSYEDTQSFIKFNTKEKWRDGFLKVLIENNYKWVKPGGYFIINVANVSTYPELEQDTIEIAKQTGFELERTYKMSLSSLMKSGFKFEPIFVFKKKYKKINE